MSQSKKHHAVIEKSCDQATLLSLVATSSLPVERISDYSNDLPKLQYYYALMLLHGYINNAIKWWKKSASQQSTALEEHRYIRFAKGNLLMIRYLGSTIVRLLNQLDRRPKTNIHPDTKAAKKFPSD